MSFLAPAWAAGFIVAALPAAAHLLARAVRTSVVFPATRFVIEAQAETRRISRWRDWILLALRTVTLCLIVLAFMQPVWRTGVSASPDVSGASAAAGSVGRHVAIIVDRTASMRRIESGRTLFEQARSRAATVLGHLDPPTDRASVILLDRQPAPLLPEPTANIALLTDRLEQTHATSEHGSVGDAIRRAYELHRRLYAAEARSLHIELFTDAQRTQWPADHHTVSVPLLGGDAQDHAATLRVHRIGQYEANDALHEPSVRPSQPIAGQSATVSVRATRFGYEATRRTIELRSAGRRQARRITLDPFTSKTIDFRVTFREPGPAVVEVRFSDGEDALAADDTTGMVAHVRPSRSVRMLSDADADDPDSAAFFVQRALSPMAGVEGGAGVNLEVHSPETLTSQVMDGYDDEPGVIVLVEAGGLAADELNALRAHLEFGGGVIWFIDGAAAAEALGRFGTEVGEAVITPSNELHHDGWSPGDVRRLGTARFDDPILAAFEGPGRAALLRQRFGATLRGKLDDKAEALIEFDDGEPMLALRRFDAGGLAVIAADMAPEATDFAKGPMFVPLMHQLLRHLAPGTPAAPNPQPGERVEIGHIIAESVAEEGMAEGAVLTKPDGTRRSLGGDVRLTEPGLYGVRDGDDGNERLLGGVWVELNLRESDLRVIEEASEYVAQGGGADVATIDSVASGPEAVDGHGREIALWPWAMLAAAVALAVEPMLLVRPWRRGASGARAKGVARHVD